MKPTRLVKITGPTLLITISEKAPYGSIPHSASTPKLFARWHTKVMMPFVSYTIGLRGTFSKYFNHVPLPKYTFPIIPNFSPWMERSPKS
jgi:hypothetical protein